MVVNVQQCSVGMLQVHNDIFLTDTIGYGGPKFS